MVAFPGFGMQGQAGPVFGRVTAQSEWRGPRTNIYANARARTGTAVGRTSLSFSDPHPQAPPVWGTGTTGGTFSAPLSLDYTLRLIFVSTRLPAERNAVKLQTPWASSCRRT